VLGHFFLTKISQVIMVFESLDSLAPPGYVDTTATNAATTVNAPAGTVKATLTDTKVTTVKYTGCDGDCTVTKTRTGGGLP